MAAAVCRGLRSWSDPGFHLTQNSILDDVCVHTPFVNPSTLRLSQKSLELCTENLGNETGSDMSDSESMEACVFSMSMTMTMTITMQEEQLLKPYRSEVIKAKKYAGFPPPLTTIKGKQLLRFKAHREQGRLVLEAVKMLPANSIFQAERSQGRLTLCFLDESAPEDEQDCGNREGEEKVEGNEEDVRVADRQMKETFKMWSRCKDSDHGHQLQHENRRLLNLGVLMGSRLLNFRLLFLVAKLSTIC